MPLIRSSYPIGTCTAAQFKPSLYLTCWIQFHGLAPILSNLLTKIILGTLYLCICLLTVKVCGWTPPTPQRSKTAPSNTLNALSTSIVKSTWPGVSIRLILWSFQSKWVAADWIVIPFYRSSSMKSIVAPTLSVPLTSWIEDIFPA